MFNVIVSESTTFVLFPKRKMLNQFRTLLAKDFLIERRRWPSLILEIFTPSIILAVLAIVNHCQQKSVMENRYFDPILIDGSAGDLESRSIDGSPVQGPDFEPTIIYFAPNSSSVITNVIIDRLSAKLSTDTEWWGENLTCQTLENINRQRFVFQGVNFTLENLNFSKGISLFLKALKMAQKWNRPC